MVSGAPDYMIVTGGRTPERTITYSQIQVPIIMFDDFESPILKWSVSGGYAEANTTDVFNGDGCMKLFTDAGGGLVAYRNVFITGQTSTIGISFYFTPGNLANFINDYTWHKLIVFRLYTGTQKKTFYVYYDYSNGNLYYSNDDESTYVLFSQRYISATYPNFIKLVIDMENNKAKYFLMNNLLFNFDDINIYVEDSTQPGAIELEIHTAAAAGKQAVLYIDDYKVTYNEPV